jgi:hexulose-6-phosphate isomerase
VTFRRLATNAQSALRADDTGAAEEALALIIDLACEMKDCQYFRSEDPVEAARFVDDFHSPSVAWHFDIGNVVPWGWPEHWIRALGKRISTLHIKEYSRAKRSQVELLEGDCDWPAIMKALDEASFSGWAIAEVAGGDAERLKFIAARMDRILAS